VGRCELVLMVRCTLCADGRHIPAVSTGTIPYGVCSEYSVYYSHIPAEQPLTMSVSLTSAEAEASLEASSFEEVVPYVVSTAGPNLDERSSAPCSNKLSSSASRFCLPLKYM
jgi:hypothetical protein